MLQTFLFCANRGVHLHLSRSQWPLGRHRRCNPLTPFYFVSDVVAVNVQVSQAYNSTQITRESIGLIFELREICLSLQMVFSLASAAVVCAILDGTLGLEPWSVTTAPKYLKQFFTADSDVNADTIRVIGHQCGLLCTDFHAKGCRSLIQVIHQGG